VKIFRSRFGRRGFTLVELVISSALMTVVLASSYLCLSAGVASRKMIESRSEAAQSARIALQMMTADLRCAVPLSPEFEFIGMRRVLEGADADNLDFATRNYSPRAAREGEWCEVSYFLRKDAGAEGYLLLRRRDPTFDPEPFAGGVTEEMARGVKELRFEYYDGFEWYEEWGDPNGKKALSAFPEPNLSDLPEAVRITMTLDPSYLSRSEDGEKEPPMVFQTVARIPMAVYFFRNSPSGSTNRTSSATSAGGSQ
jgi:type II secretion system protein J